MDESDKSWWKWIKYDYWGSQFMKVDESGWELKKMGKSRKKWTKEDKMGWQFMKWDESGRKWMEM